MFQDGGKVNRQDAKGAKKDATDKKRAGNYF